MSRLVSTAKGIGVVEPDPAGETVAYVDVDHPDLGAALAAGMTVAEIAAAPRRDRAPLSGAELLPTIPCPSKIWAVGYAYASHRVETGFREQGDAPVIFPRPRHRPSRPAGRSACRRSPRTRSTTKASSGS